MLTMFKCLLSYGRRWATKIHKPNLFDSFVSYMVNFVRRDSWLSSAFPDHVTYFKPGPEASRDAAKGFILASAACGCSIHILYIPSNKIVASRDAAKGLTSACRSVMRRDQPRAAPQSDALDQCLSAVIIAGAVMPTVQPLKWSMQDHRNTVEDTDLVDAMTIHEFHHTSRWSEGSRPVAKNNH